MELNLTTLSYAVCALLVLLHSWERFNTPIGSWKRSNNPNSNRSSTRLALYWSSCAGYILTKLALFVVLSLLLAIPAWRHALLGDAADLADTSVPSILIATLAVTTLLPSLPVLKSIDTWVLEAFLNWGAIPAEALRRANTMRWNNFSVSKADVIKLREAFADGDCGATLTTHLRERATDGLALSQYRLTCVAKLYDSIQNLTTEPRYSRFFHEASEEFSDLEKSVPSFLRRSDGSLTLAARLHLQESKAAYEELIHELRELFAQGCRETFNRLSLFLACAVLRSESTEKDIVGRLRYIGFKVEPMNEPEFPIHSLTLLALGVFLYLALLSVLFSHIGPPPSDPEIAGPGGTLVFSFKIALVRLVTIGVTVWLMQRFVFFRRRPSNPPKYFAYTLCGIIAIGVGALVSLPFAIAAKHPAQSLENSLPLIVLSGLLCAVLAYCFDDWPEERKPPYWLRIAEALGCAATMALGTTFIYFADLLPPAMQNMQGWLIVGWISLPSVMAFIFGACVPHIYRSAHRAAIASRQEALLGAALEPETSQATT